MRLDEERRRLVEEMIPQAQRMSTIFAKRSNLYSYLDDIMGDVYLALCRDAVVADLGREEVRRYLGVSIKWTLREWFQCYVNRHKYSAIGDDFDFGWPDRSVDEFEDHPVIVKVMEHLTEKQRVALLLKMAGHTESEMGHMMDCDPAAAKMLAVRGMKKAREVANTIG